MNDAMPTACQAPARFHWGARQTILQLSRTCVHRRSLRPRVCTFSLGQKEKRNSSPGIQDRKQQLEEGTRQEEPKWNVLEYEAYDRPWKVPWGVTQTALTFIGWVSIFLLVSLVTIPGLLAATGADLQTLTSQQKVGLVVLNQVLETGSGIAIILYLLRNYRPFPADIFTFSLRKPFSKPDGWLVWAFAGYLLAPFVVALTANVFQQAGYTNQGPSTVDEVVKIISPDAWTFTGLFGVTSVLAPLLEEFVFRGFLLTSLSSFLPLPYAVVSSSLAFGLAHLSVKDFPELTVLGIILACSYLRTKNLMTPIVIHGLWNGTVLIALFAFAQTAKQ